MRAGLILLCATLSAHRLDEYLQATTILLEKDRVAGQIRLTPGVAVFAKVMPLIDTDADGAVSVQEQQSYAARVLGDLSLAVDGAPSRLQLIAASFPPEDAMKEGLGEIRIDFAVPLSREGRDHELVLENRHQRAVGTYLVNALVPADPGTRILTQERSYDQSRYRMEYVQGQAALTPVGRGWLAMIAVGLLLCPVWLWRKWSLQHPVG